MGEKNMKKGFKSPTWTILTVTKSERGKVPMMKIIEMILKARILRCKYLGENRKQDYLMINPTTVLIQSSPSSSSLLTALVWARLRK